MEHVGIYDTGKITFYLYPHSVVFCTGFQCTRITYTRYIDRRYLDRLKIAIIDGKIVSLVDISTYNKGAKLLWNNCTQPCS